MSAFASPPDFQKLLKSAGDIHPVMAAIGPLLILPAVFCTAERFLDSLRTPEQRAKNKRTRAARGLRNGALLLAWYIRRGRITRRVF